MPLTYLFNDIYHLEWDSFPNIIYKVLTVPVLLPHIYFISWHCGVTAHYQK